MIRVEMPWAPSVNSLYRPFRNRVILSRKGRAWYKENLPKIKAQWNRAPLTGPVRVKIQLYPPDRRRRDLDNALKAPCDCLTKAGVWRDDSQVVELSIAKLDPTDPPAILIWIEEVAP